jgi:hypothetical protein
MRFSDPYEAYSYDVLHRDDLGEWGKHLWVTVLQRLEKEKKKSEFARL